MGVVGPGPELEDVRRSSGVDILEHAEHRSGTSPSSVHMLHIGYRPSSKELLKEEAGKLDEHPHSDPHTGTGHYWSRKTKRRATVGGISTRPCAAQREDTHVFGLPLDNGMMTDIVCWYQH